MNTFTFTLPSGVEAEVGMISGKHQRILTEQDGKTFGEKLNKMLADLLVRVGDITKFDEDFVKAMLSADRRYALVTARMFALDDGTPESKKFKFTWKYLSSAGKKEELELEEDLSAGFNMVPYKTQCALYSEIKKDITISLPSGAECVFKLMDGFSEETAQLTKKNERSSHTAVIMRNPRIIQKSNEGNKVPIQADLDKMALKDIEYLRKAIKEHEGKVDTEMMFEHPEAELKSPNEKEVVLDLLGQLAFFFPSEAI